MVGIIYTDTHKLVVVTTFYALRVLYQAHTSSSKYGLKNIVKVTTIKQLMWCYSQIGDSCKK